jgi:hypothetical protein
VGVSSVLYFFNLKTRKFVFQKDKITLGLFILRTWALFLITILLVSPFINLNVNRSLKPKVVLLVDNSASIQTYDGITLKSYKEMIQALENQISDFFDVETHYFSDKLDAKDSFLLQGSRTDIYNALQSADELHFNENVQSVILVSDGNSNIGNNFNYYNFTNPVECYSLLVGDTTRFFDIEIGAVDFNPLAYLNEKSNISIQVLADQAAGKSLTLTLYEMKGNGSSVKLQSKNILPNSASYSENHSFAIKMTQEGIHHYRMFATCVSGEKNCDNNYKDFFIEVVNGKKKIVIFADVPHPDISAIKSALEKNEAFDVKVQMLQESQPVLDEIDLAVLYQIPSQYANRIDFIKKLNEKGISILYFLGSGSNYNMFNQVQSLYNTSPQGNLRQDILPQLNKDFSFFKLTENVQANYVKFPPMQSMYLNINPVKQSEILMYQKIGNVTTNKPLISMGFMDNQSVGIVFAENIWKWKMMDFKNFKSFEHFEEIVVKTANFLAVKKDKKKFKVHFDKTFYTEKEDINADAAVYNASYELINTSDVFMEIYGNNKYQSKGTFLKNGDKYSLNLGNLPSGNYEYQAYTILNGVKMVDKGNFAVTTFQLEKAYKKANYEDMNKFAQNHNGELVLLKDWKKLIDIFKKKESKDLLISESKTITFIDSWILMSIILLLLSLEWIFRKYFGKN